MKILQPLVVLLIGGTLSCQSSGVQRTDDKKGVELYLITSPTDLSVDRTALDKIPLTLDKEPLIDYAQINSYTADTHTFQIKTSAINKLKELSNTIPLSGKPFALVVDDSVVYAGLFWNPISSFTAHYPFIILDKTNGSESITVAFMIPPPGGITRPDLRNSTRLLERLKQDAKLR